MRLFGMARSPGAMIEHDGHENPVFLTYEPGGGPASGVPARINRLISARLPA
jgi:hypothetical protein